MFLYTEPGVKNSGYNSYFKVAVIRQAWRHGAKKKIYFHERLKPNGAVEGYYRHEYKSEKMRKFDTKEELVEWIETMHLQNTNGGETKEKMFRLGIEAAIEELNEFNLLFSIK